MAQESMFQHHPRTPPACLIFSNLGRMNLNMLPTIEDVLMDYQWIRLELKTNPKKEPTVAEVSDVLAMKIKEIWNRASIPIVTSTQILQLIRNYHDRYLKLVRYSISKRNEQYE